MTDRKLAWTGGGWEDYLYWQGQDPRTLNRINFLIEDIQRGDPFFAGRRQARARLGSSTR